MIVLTNCLTDVVDEGCLKISNSLVKRIKNRFSDTFVISYQRRSGLTDAFLNINKLMLNRELFSIIRKKNEPVLYLPFPARPNFSALRVFILSLVSKKRLKVVFVMKQPYNVFAKILLKLSRAQFVVFSKEAYDFYTDIVPQKCITYIKTGVDTKKFFPVSQQEAELLKEKYGFDKDKKVILHVGHIKSGRNVQQLLKIDPKYQVVLVSSTLTKDEQDTQIKDQLKSRPNITIIEDYLENIEQIYQLSDIYFFPVVEKENCVDVPLSCFEAAACNKPIVTTQYGEMNELKGKSGFYFIDEMNSDTINQLLDKAIQDQACTRDAVLSYDWDNALDDLVMDM